MAMRMGIGISRRPVNFQKHIRQLLASSRIQHRDMRDPALQVMKEIVDPISILTGRPVPDAVRQYGLQSIKFCSGNIRSVVDDDARDCLTLMRPQDTTLGLVYKKTFLSDDLLYERYQCCQPVTQFGWSRQRQIVGVPGIGCSERIR